MMLDTERILRYFVETGELNSFEELNETDVSVFLAHVDNLRKERDELKRKWDQRHMDLEIVCAYDAGCKRGEKERDELAAQVAAYYIEMNKLHSNYRKGPGEDSLVTTWVLQEAFKVGIDPHPAAARLMRELEALRRLSAYLTLYRHHMLPATHNAVDWGAVMEEVAIKLKDVDVAKEDTVNE